MSLGKSIRIYLKDGNVSGIKLAEVVNHTIHAISCPRSMLAEINQFFSKEVNKPGVYFLIGEDDSDEYNKPIVYIGESENIWLRIGQQDTFKEFWNEVIFFTSKDDNLTKSHVKYLESKLIKISDESKRYKLVNGIVPNLNSLPLPDRDAMDDFIIYIKLLNGTLGHKFLEPTIPKVFNSENTDSFLLNTQINASSSIDLELNIKGINAKAIMTDEGIVVLKDSEAFNGQLKSYGYSTLREKLVSDKLLISSQNGKLIFREDYLFKSPSAAAAVIMGYSINGRDWWKDKNGRSINEIEKIKVGFSTENKV